MPLAVNVLAAATPEPFAVTVCALVPPVAKVPLAPDAGAVKATEAPLMTTLAASLTVTCSAVAKALFTVADWLSPAVMVSDAATWSTVVPSNCDGALAAPPPDRVTLALTDTGEVRATATFRVMAGPLPVPNGVVVVQDPDWPEPLQLQLAPLALV